MKDYELKALVAGLAASQEKTSEMMRASRKEAEREMRELRASQQETDRGIRELRAAQQETDRGIRELRAAQQETDRGIRELRAAQRETDRGIRELRASQQETDRGIRELRASQQETDREIRELRTVQQETDRIVKETFSGTGRMLEELGKQIGGLGRKFGGLTEGMAFPSMKKLLRERFRMEFITPHVEVTRNGNHMELDVLGYSNGARNQAVVVEIKSCLTQEGIERMERNMTRFDEFFPEHAHKRRFGIIAAVDVSAEMATQTLDRGFYLARIRDELFVLETPTSFRPRYFEAESL